MQLNRCLRIILQLAVVISLLAACRPPPPSLVGETRLRQLADTTVLDYRFTMTNPYASYYGRVDSVTIRLEGYGKDSIIYLRPDIDSVNPPAHLLGGVVDSNVSVTGRIVCPSPALASCGDYVISLYSGHRDDYPATTYRLKTQPACQPGLGMIFGLGMGYFDRSFYPPEVRSVSYETVGAFTMGMAAAYREVTSTTAFHIAGWGSGDSSEARSTYFFRPVSANLRYYPLGRDHWWPAVHGGLEYAKIRVKHPLASFTREEVGVIGGLTIEDKWLRLQYSYSTALGGYHMVEYLAPFLAGPLRKAGTKYSYLRGDDFELFTVEIYVEASDSGMRTPDYRDRRTFIEKTLSAGLFAPLYLAAKLLQPGS